MSKVLFLVEDLDRNFGSIGRNAMLSQKFDNLDKYIGNYGSIGGLGDLANLLLTYKCRSEELSCKDIFISEYPIYTTPRIFNKSLINRLKRKEQILLDKETTNVV